MGVDGGKSVLRVPELIVYGTNTVNELKKHAGKHGKKVVLVYGTGSLKKSGNYDRIMDILGPDEFEITEISGITHDPDEELIKEVTEKVKQVKPDVIIGAGGGSVLDAAKASSMLATNGGEVKDYWGGKKFSRPSIPCVAVPTTSGTGSEATNNAVISSRDHTFKKSIRSSYMMPNIALVDPSLTLGSPPGVTINTGLDALIQNLEGFTSRNSGPITDTLALKGIELSGKYLRRAAEDPQDLEAREALSLTSLYGGITLLNAGLGLAHGLSHPIGINFGVPHGRACALVMPKVMEYNYTARAEKYKQAGRLLSGTNDGVKAFQVFLESLGIKPELSRYGVKKEHIPALVEGSKGGSRNYNPIPHSDETVSRMLEELL
ncbi:MAG: iron-containing alcohol dehydrogenase [Spirochaetota bacterium]